MRAAAFSPDGQRLASGSGATETLVWDVAKFDQSAPAEPAPTDATSLWNDLAPDTDGTKVQRAIARLSTSPKGTLMLFQKHLHPAKPLGGDEQKRIAQLIALLDADNFQKREKAAAELEAMGTLAAGLLRKALEGTRSLEARSRLERLLQKLGPPGQPTDMRMYRALEVLERLDTPEARQLVGMLARGDPGSWLTQEAQRTLQRLNRLTLNQAVVEGPS